MSDYSLLLKSGGIVRLKNCFMVGNSIAGDVSPGELLSVSEDDIQEVIRHEI